MCPSSVSASVFQTALPTLRLDQFQQLPLNSAGVATAAAAHPNLAAAAGEGAVMQAPLAVQQPAETAEDPDNAAWITSDEFRMYHFKISLCSKRFNHDWNFCPYAHTGERACRRDPLRYNYTSVTCLDMLQKGKCPRGDACQAAHSVFEFWLHPHRYRTEMCKVGAGCNRRICFFAHKPEELRPLPEHLANEEGPAGGKYSLSAALPGGASSTTRKEGDQPGELSRQQQRQRLHGANSSSSSSTSIVHLSSSLLAAGSNAGGSSNTHSPSAPTSWLLPSCGPDNAQTAAAATAAAMLGVGGFDSLALAAASMPQAASSSSSSSPHALYSSLAGQLPPRMPQVGSTSPWQQQQQLNVVTLQGQTQLLLQPQQQQSPPQQQQGFAVSNGLSLQLQQLSLAGQPSLNSAAAAAAAAQDTAGLACSMQAQVFASGPWQQQQQQQHQMLQYGMSLQQQQQLLSAAPAATVSCAMPAVAAHDALGVAAFDAHHHQQQQRQQQQLLLQGQLQAAQACVPAMLASVTAAPQALCGVGLQQPQHINFMHGQVLQ